MCPTIFGPDKSPSYQVSGSSTIIDGPGGIDLKDAIKIADALPVPMYQWNWASKRFDLKIRFSPTVENARLQIQFCWVSGDA